MEVMRSLCKYCKTCSSVREIVPVLRGAFQAAMSGVPGPVFVELPLDLLYPANEMRAAMNILRRSKASEVLANKALWSAVSVPVEWSGGPGDVEGFLRSRRDGEPVFLAPEHGKEPSAIAKYGMEAIV